VRGRDKRKRKRERESDTRWERKRHLSFYTRCHAHVLNKHLGLQHLHPYISLCIHKTYDAYIKTYVYVYIYTHTYIYIYACFQSSSIALQAYTFVYIHTNMLIYLRIYRAREREEREMQREARVRGVYLSHLTTAYNGAKGLCHHLTFISYLKTSSILAQGRIH
jgi:hypothetical protein